jgi:predicted N-formylglutamate amidohydrolase
MTASPPRLLGPDEPAPVIHRPGRGPTPFVIACDHAGRRIPAALGTLGLPAHELDRHIAWDIGAAPLSEHLAAAFGAPLVMQTYSRLVIDCNRKLDHPTSIPVISERTEIPGNRDVSPTEVATRAREIFAPYHAALAETLDARAGLPTLLVAVHSFTPVFMDVARPWQAGVLYHLETRLAGIMIDLLRAEGDLTVGDNEPYVLTSTSDYTVPHHAEARGLPYLELEIRQDLIADAAGQRAWGERLVRLLPLAWERYRQHV